MQLLNTCILLAHPTKHKRLSETYRKLVNFHLNSSIDRSKAFHSPHKDSCLQQQWSEQYRSASTAVPINKGILEDKQDLNHLTGWLSCQCNMYYFCFSDHMSPHWNNAKQVVECLCKSITSQETWLYCPERLLQEFCKYHTAGPGSWHQNDLFQFHLFFFDMCLGTTLIYFQVKQFCF